MTGARFCKCARRWASSRYQLDGRPDGARPYGQESALDHYLERLEKTKAAGREGEFELSERECGELFNEGTLYYFRYVRLFQLKEWERTVRDTARNLRAFDLARRYAQREEDRQFLEMAPLYPPGQRQRRRHDRAGP